MKLPKIEVRRGHMDKVPCAFKVIVNGHDGTVAGAPDIEAARKYAAMLTGRDVVALVAVANGRARRHSPGWSDEWLAVECDEYGIGHGTLWRLQRDGTHHAAFVTTPTKPGPLRLTPYGRAVLRGLAKIPGVNIDR